MHACIRAGGGRKETCALERQYHSSVRSRRRAFQQQQLRGLLVEQRRDPRCFWRRLRGSRHGLPPQLLPLQRWGPYLARVGNIGSPPGATLPAEAFPQHNTAPAAALNSPITEQEVLDGLGRLNNGRAAGPLGLPAELLRYARATATADCADPPHLLAPTLARLLNAAFQAGQVPSSVNAGLVSPVDKRGDTCETANYRPIVVSEPVMRL